MTRSKRIRLVAAVATAPVIALIAAGCGGGSGGGDSAAANPPPKTTSGGATISTASEGNLGTVLVDSQGRTLYLFGKDSAAKSACFGPCATEWPPLRDGGKSTAGSGLDSSLVGTTSRSDGMAQVTYNGHPLYLFAGDQKPGDTGGQGLTDFGASWYALNGTGNQVTSQASSATTSSSSSGGYAY